MDRLPIIWLTGNSGAGKTTLAEGVRTCFNEPNENYCRADSRVIVLDGNAMRETISRDEGFSPEDRRRHNLRVARLAKLLRDQGFIVVVAVIAPFANVREEIDALCDPLWVFVKRRGLEVKEKPYEPPEHPDLIIDNDRLSREEGCALLREFIAQKMGKAIALV